MGFKIYYKFYYNYNTCHQYKIINETNIENAKIKFFNFINEKYCKPARIEIIKIEKIIDNRIYEIERGGKNND